MAYDDKHSSLDDIVKRLVDETGVSEAQALELIYLLGVNWGSLIREAKAIRAGSKAGPRR